MHILIDQNSSQYKTFEESLNFLHMNELRRIADQLSLPDKGKKICLIMRILNFVSIGKIIEEPEIPAISCAMRGKIYPIHKHALILKGSYKNDLKTRLFFKQLIGEYFHFTAFGIDWLNKRWMSGNPPTYGEFADYWKK